jgi:hypothetical protein
VCLVVSILNALIEIIRRIYSKQYFDDLVSKKDESILISKVISLEIPNMLDLIIDLPKILKFMIINPLKFMIVSFLYILIYYLLSMLPVLFAIVYIISILMIILTIALSVLFKKDIILSGNYLIPKIKNRYELIKIFIMLPSR